MKGENVGFSPLKCTRAPPLPRSPGPHGALVYSLAHSQAAGGTTHILLEPFRKALLLLKMFQDYLEEGHTTEKLNSRPAFDQK